MQYRAIYVCDSANSYKSHIPNRHYTPNMTICKVYCHKAYAYITKHLKKSNLVVNITAIRI